MWTITHLYPFVESWRSLEESPQNSLKHTATSDKSVVYK